MQTPSVVNLTSKAFVSICTRLIAITMQSHWPAKMLFVRSGSGFPEVHKAAVQLASFPFLSRLFLFINHTAQHCASGSMSP